MEDQVTNPTPAADEVEVQEGAEEAAPEAAEESAE
jgi:hypothetical protein